MTTWFERDPQRFEKERELMERSTTGVLRKMGNELAWAEDLVSSATGRAYRLVLTYPERFPYEPPKAFIVSPPIDHAPHRLTDGSLCLFPDHLVAAGLKTTALLVRTRAVVWFLAYEVWTVTGEWMAPQH
jgi:hypothetical protein